MASFEGTLYVGVTINLTKRVNEHKLGIYKGFSYKYHCQKLVYYEYIPSIRDAIRREKQIKKWSRKKKEKLIIEINPNWSDLSEGE